MDNTTQTNSFFAATCDKGLLMPVCIDKSPTLSFLKSKKGEEVLGHKRENMPTGVVVKVEAIKLNNWDISSVLREFAQNISDACIKTTASVEEPKIWATEETPTGAVFYLNNHVAGEWFTMYETKSSEDGDKHTVHLFFYNRGCALIEDAFQPGSYKGSTNKYIAGGHGLGLKDLIGLMFHKQMGYQTLTAITYDPNGIEYSDFSEKYFRRYDLDVNNKLVDKGFAQFSGVYGLNVTDSDHPPRSKVPLCVRQLLKRLYDEKDSAATLFWMKKSVPTEEIAKREVQTLKRESKHHLYFTVSADHHKKIIVQDKFTHTENILIVHSTPQREMTAYIYPGLKNCSKPYHSSAVPERRLDIVFSPMLVKTNRDRIQTYNHQMSFNFGCVLVSQMQLECERTKFRSHIMTTNADVSGTASNQQQKMIKNYKDVLQLLQELQMEVTYIVASHICYDIHPDKHSQSHLSVITAALVDFARELESQPQLLQKHGSFLIDFIANLLFGHFEKVKTEVDYYILQEIQKHYDLLQQRQSQKKQKTQVTATAVTTYKPPSCKPPLILTGDASVTLFGKCSFDSTKAIDDYLLFLISQSSPWFPQGSSKKIWQNVSKLSEEEEYLSIYILDLPLFFFCPAAAAIAAGVNANRFSSSSSASAVSSSVSTEVSIEEGFRFLLKEKMILLSKELFHLMAKDHKVAMKVFQKLAAKNSNYIYQSLAQDMKEGGTEEDMMITAADNEDDDEDDEEEEREEGKKEEEDKEEDGIAKEDLTHEDEIEIITNDDAEDDDENYFENDDFGDDDVMIDDDYDDVDNDSDYEEIDEEDNDHHEEEEGSHGTEEEDANNDLYNDADGDDDGGGMESPTSSLESVRTVDATPYTLSAVDLHTTIATASATTGAIVKDADHNRSSATSSSPVAVADDNATGGEVVHPHTQVLETDVDRSNAEDSMEGGDDTLSTIVSPVGLDNNNDDSIIMEQENEDCNTNDSCLDCTSLLPYNQEDPDHEEDTQPAADKVSDTTSGKKRVREEEEQTTTMNDNHEDTNRSASSSSAAASPAVHNNHQRSCPFPAAAFPFFPNTQSSSSSSSSSTSSSLYRISDEQLQYLQAMVQNSVSMMFSTIREQQREPIVANDDEVTTKDSKKANK